MTYKDFAKKAKTLAIVEDRDTQAVYVNPDWMIKIMDIWNDFKDSDEGMLFTIQDIGDMLKLEVERRKALRSKTDRVVGWLYDVIFSAIEPRLTEEENKLFKNLMEYLETGKGLDQKEKELLLKEDQLKKKENIVSLMPGLNFGKMT